MANKIHVRLTHLRQIMKEAGISAVVVPQADPHMSEYLSAHWQARRMLSGFTGSAGDLVVTLDKALLWTDSRYFLQAAAQLQNTEIKLMKDGLAETPSIASWLASNLSAGQTVGIDGMMFSVAAAQDLAMRLNARSIALDSAFNPIDSVWSDRPALPKCPVFVHDMKYAGESALSKIQSLLEGAERQSARSVFVSALDEIAWTLNIRSNDVTYNPVATAFMYLAPQGSVLFVDPDKITPEVSAYLAEQGVGTAPYNSVKAFLTALPENSQVLVDTARTPSAIVDLLGNRAVRGTSVASMPKACKNDVQVEGFRNAALRDGVAMVESLCEIHERVDSGEQLTEWDVACILRRHRSAQPLFFDISFGSIVGYQANGAVIHYEPSEAVSTALRPEGILLIDSGAQYLDGTTDITRTIALGPTTEAQRRDFTLVFKGHVALTESVFREGTCGTQLDVLARQFMWREGVAYLHGTGHGVGHFLNVHEGPHQFRMNHMPAPISPGMITTNEPGIYRDGQYGIRCENMMLTVPALTTEFGRFFKFETLTLCPYDTSLLDLGLITPQEAEWLNSYHDRVRRELTPLLSEKAAKWLEAQTQPVKI